ncbi:MAG: DUF1080 domain-containing protein [Verrucomicrobiae bacterium]|nr:DUF1080 domain-containing protein [Verrucomicrobiae bacterium]MCO5053855.1 DUF1080 domain-containing protein [Verrucomicrobiae bacterium]
MKWTWILSLTVVALTSGAVAQEAGFKSLMDGKTFAGWQLATENTNSFRIEDGAFVANGNACHLFYVGDEQPFKNFHLKVEVKTDPVSNGGIYFHTKYQEKGWPRGGFECQVNNTHGDWKKTGSLYDAVNVSQSLARDNQWWTQEIIVEGSKVTVKVDGQIVLEYNEPPGAQPGKDFERKLSQGTFALQAHDPKSVVRYRNIRVKRL